MNSPASFFSDRPQLFSGASDPLSQVLALLRPCAESVRVLHITNQWTAQDGGLPRPLFCAALEGRGLLDVSGHGPALFDTFDLVLVRGTPAISVSGFADGVRVLMASFHFDCVDPLPLLSLLPGLLRIRESPRMSLLLQAADYEYRCGISGCAFMLLRLAELMLGEAMRQATVTFPPPGLLRGLGDGLLVGLLQELHARVDHPWTVTQVAGIARMSRSAFHERFSMQVGMGPMEYLLWWRMLIAKDLLARSDLPVSVVARRTGYGSTSAFSVAFSRHFGVSPAQYARRHGACTNR